MMSEDAEGANLLAGSSEVTVPTVDAVTLDVTLSSTLAARAPTPPRDPMLVLGEQLIHEYGLKERPEVLLRVSRNGHEIIVASPELQADRECVMTAIGR